MTPTAYQELADAVHTARVLREWSRSLRMWSAATRRGLVAHGVDAPFPGMTRDVDGVALGDVSVVDLFVILVENHQFEVREAVRQLTIGLVKAGYPADHESVAASDAMDILESILERS